MGQIGGDGVALFYTSIVLIALAWVTYGARVAVRVWRKVLGLDDLLMFIGLLLFTVTASLCIVCCFYGSGQLSVDIDPTDKMHGIKLFFIAEFFYASGTVFIKSSIAVTLLRIADARRRYTWTIWGIMFATAVSAIIFIIGVANICHPITTLWGETTTGSCNLVLNSNVSFFFSAIEIATDWSLAILPAILLWNIQMKPKVRFSVAAILGLAAFASCATIVRLRYLSLYADPTEFMFGTGKIGLWSIIEEGIGITAGSLPALRPLLSHPFFSRSTTASNASASHSGGKFKPSKNRNSMMRSHVQMDTFQQLGGKDGEGEVDGGGDGDSQKHILKETHVTVKRNKRTDDLADWERSQVLPAISPAGSQASS